MLKVPTRRRRRFRARLRRVMVTVREAAFKLLPGSAGSPIRATPDSEQAL